MSKYLKVDTPGGVPPQSGTSSLIKRGKAREDAPVLPLVSDSCGIYVLGQTNHWSLMLWPLPPAYLFGDTHRPKKDP